MSLALLAQIGAEAEARTGADAAPGVTDNEVLDEFTVPFGNWVEEATLWANDHLQWLFDAISWPFDALLELVVDDFLAADWMPWFVVVALIALVGALTRNVRVGLVSGAAIGFCGFLGNDFWLPTVETVGMVIVAVTLCALVGIPLGILCGRFDSVWSAVRPVLDGMQVVHPFVYLLPVIFFFGIGRTPGVLVTMVFALPPLVRLTNLGIRQVPEDVVEASRSYGAPESRVLRDVQLPLARPAIMTGLNQCLLMAISMVGIIALIAGGGLGQMVLRGVQTLNTPLAASAGLALYLVAVVLDRLSQTEGETASLGARITRAWANRKTPENLLELAAEQSEESDEPDSYVEPTHSRERVGALVALAGVVIGVVGLFLPWGTDGSAIGGYPAAEELDLTGSFNGFDSLGGSWFGLLAFGAVVVLAFVSLGPAFRRADWPRSLGPEMGIAAAMTMLAMGLAYLLMNPGAFAGEDFSKGIGPIIVVLGGVVAIAGTVMTLTEAPYRPRRVAVAGVRAGQVVAMVATLALALGGVFGSWIYDERSGVLAPEVQAEIDELLENAVTDAEKASAAVEIASLSRSDSGPRVVTGLDDNGPDLGLVYLLFAGLGVLLGLLTAFPKVAAGHRRWRLNAVAYAMGWAGMAIPAAWILSLVRIVPPRFYSGAGSFSAVLGGVLLAAMLGATFANWAREVQWTSSADEAFTRWSEAA